MSPEFPPSGGVRTPPVSAPSGEIATAQRSFDPVAAARYVARAQQFSEPWLHAEVARRMADKLPFIRHQPRRVLEWWAGLGASHAVLDAALPQAARWACEPDAQWQRKTQIQRRAPWWNPLRWSTFRAHHASRVVLPGDAALVQAQGFDLLWSNMSLHHDADPPKRFVQWERWLAPEGFVMFSCLGPDTLKELRALYARQGWGSASTGFVDMHDLGDMMVRAGFADPVMDQETLTLTWASAAQALAELRQWGANTSPHRHAGLRTPRWRERLEGAMEEVHGAGERITLTFEVVYGHAFKASASPARTQETRVGVDEMRSLIRASRRSA